MRLKFTADIIDPDTGLCFGNDQDFEIEAELSGIRAGNLLVDVSGVWLDGVNLLTSVSHICRLVGWIVADKAEQSEYVINTLREAAEEERMERAYA